MTLHILRIEIDGHWHGSGEVPKPWVARIEGADDKYGLKRQFLDRMNDWRDARKAWSGNRYGVVATFALREGLYEICRARGRASKRYMAREYRWCDAGKLHERTALEVLASVDGGSGDEQKLQLLDAPSVYVSKVTGLGSPRRLAWTVDESRRVFRLLADRIYEIREDDDRRLVTMSRGAIITLSQSDAWARLRKSA